MFDKSIEISMKALRGEELLTMKKSYLQKRNAKYELVKYIYMEKMKHEKAGLVDFNFTP